MFSRLASQSSVVAAGFAAASASVLAVSHASDDHIPSVRMKWAHSGNLDSFDSASIRRGFQVYKEVCASCHSLELIRWRDLIGVTHTEEELKTMAADCDYVDADPGDDGEPVERPGRLTDSLPSPYKNEQMARFSNNGALPPDLSLMKKARHDGEDYLFALLTGYYEPPAGKMMLPGLHYNPYFPGGSIAMEQQIFDGKVEYEDGTPATASQMAKDVSVFLAWAAEPEHDKRKKLGLKLCLGFFMMACVTGYYKRLRFQPLKTSKGYWTK